MPAPSTPSFVTFDFGTSAGRTDSLSALPLLTNIVRIRLRATGPVTSCAKYFASTSRPFSSGSSVPSNTHERIAAGAG